MDPGRPATGSGPTQALRHARACSPWKSSGSGCRQRVDARVDEMFHRGLLDEVAALPQPLSRTVAQAIGVREMLAVLAGELTSTTPGLA